MQSSAILYPLALVWLPTASQMGGPCTYSKVPPVLDLDLADPLYPANQKRVYTRSTDIIDQVYTTRSNTYGTLLVLGLGAPKRPRPRGRGLGSLTALLYKYGGNLYESTCDIPCEVLRTHPTSLLAASSSSSSATNCC